VPDIQRISKTSDTEMLAVDSSTAEIQIGLSLSRSDISASSREDFREKAV
jgi:hypothetical protein